MQCCQPFLFHLHLVVNDETVAKETVNRDFNKQVKRQFCFSCHGDRVPMLTFVILPFFLVHRLFLTWYKRQGQSQKTLPFKGLSLIAGYMTSQESMAFGEDSAQTVIKGKNAAN